MEHGIKDIAFYVQKHIVQRTVCYNLPLVRDKPLGAPLYVKLVCKPHSLSQHNPGTTGACRGTAIT